MSSVFITYTSISSLVIGNTGIDRMIFMAGQLNLVLGVIIGLMAYTDSIETSYDTLKSLQKSLNERLVWTRNKADRQFLKSQIRRIEMLGQINACGYFSIDKSTLTSMMSVR